VSQNPESGGGWQHASGLSRDDRTIALVAHVLTFIEGGIIGPLVVYFLKRDSSEFIAFHALQSVYFGLMALVIILPVAIFTCGLGAVLVVPYFVYEVWACLKAYDGEWYRLPLAGDLAAQRHPPPV
jgi:uncharacterized protein